MLIGPREVKPRLEALALSLDEFALIAEAPKPVVHLSPRRPRWRASDIDFWIGQMLESARAR